MIYLRNAKLNLFSNWEKDLLVRFIKRLIKFIGKLQQ